MTRSSSARRNRLLRIVVTVSALFGAAGIFLSQVRVVDESVSAERTCGSPFDSVADRSGWQLWWASDVDEPDEAIRAALVRTTLCPSAVNGRMMLAASLGAVAAVGVIVGRRDRTVRVAPSNGTALANRVARTGQLTTWAGGTLTAAGLVGLTLLVADADSTIFLYTDRVVVVLIGLIVLTPTIALFSIGRAISLVASDMDRSTQKELDA